MRCVMAWATGAFALLCYPAVRISAAEPPSPVDAADAVKHAPSNPEPFREHIIEYRIKSKPDDSTSVCVFFDRIGETEFSTLILKPGTISLTCPGFDDVLNANDKEYEEPLKKEGVYLRALPEWKSGDALSIREDLGLLRVFLNQTCMARIRVSGKAGLMTEITSDGLSLEIARRISLDIIQNDDDFAAAPTPSQWTFHGNSWWFASRSDENRAINPGMLCAAGKPQEPAPAGMRRVAIDSFGLGVNFSFMTARPVVLRVSGDCPAASAGIRVGDILTTVNGKSVLSADSDYDLRTIIPRPPAKLDLSLHRPSTGKTIRVKLNSRPGLWADPANLASCSRLPSLSEHGDLRMALTGRDYMADYRVDVSTRIDSGAAGGLVFYAKGPKDYHALRWDSDSNSPSLRLIKVTSGIESSLGSYELPPLPGQYYRLGAAILGSRITASLDGHEIMSVEDVDAFAGMAGLLAAGDGEVCFDDFTMRDAFIEDIPIETAGSSFRDDSRMGEWAGTVSSPPDDLNCAASVFNRVPVDWWTFGAPWELTNRWICDPSWSHLGSISGAITSIWHKDIWSGDGEASFHLAPMMTDVLPPFEKMQDIALIMPNDMAAPLDGYMVVYRPDGRRVVELWRKGVCVAAGRDDRAFFPPSSPSSQYIHRSWQKFTMARKEGDITFSVNDAPCMVYHDPDPVPTARVGLAAFNNGLLLARADLRFSKRGIGPQRLLVLKRFADSTLSNFVEGAISSRVEEIGKGYYRIMNMDMAGGTMSVRLRPDIFSAEIRRFLTMRFRASDSARIDIYFNSFGRSFRIRLTGPEAPPPGVSDLRTAAIISESEGWKNISVDLLQSLKTAIPGIKHPFVSDMMLGNLSNTGWLLLGGGGNGTDAWYEIGDIQIR